jgi:hypothetical protein
LQIILEISSPQSYAILQTQLEKIMHIRTIDVVTADGRKISAHIPGDELIEHVLLCRAAAELGEAGMRDIEAVRPFLTETARIAVRDALITHLNIVGGAK